MGLHIDSQSMRSESEKQTIKTKFNKYVINLRRIRNVDSRNFKQYW